MLEWLYHKLLCPKTRWVFDPDSPSMYFTVTRTWIGRLYKSKSFATRKEAIKYYKSVHNKGE
jgi:hypothetical protein